MQNTNAGPAPAKTVFRHMAQPLANLDQGEIHIRQRPTGRERDVLLMALRILPATTLMPLPRVSRLAPATDERLVLCGRPMSREKTTPDSVNHGTLLSSLHALAPFLNPPKDNAGLPTPHNIAKTTLFSPANLSQICLSLFFAFPKYSVTSCY